MTRNEAGSEGKDDRFEEMSHEKLVGGEIWDVGAAVQRLQSKTGSHGTSSEEAMTRRIPTQWVALKVRQMLNQMSHPGVPRTGSF